MGIRRGVAFGQQRGAFLIRVQHGVQDAAVGGGRFLRHAPDPGARGQADLPAIQRQLTPDQPEQRGLASPVRPDQTHLVASE